MKKSKKKLNKLEKKCQKSKHPECRGSPNCLKVQQKQQKLEVDMEQWAMGVNLVQDKLRQGPLGQAYKLCGKLFKKMTGGDSDSKETKGERKQQESKGQSQSNRGPGVLQTRTTTGGEGKDDGDGDGHEERRGKKDPPGDKVIIDDQEQEKGEDDEEEERTGK